MYGSRRRSLAVFFQWTRGGVAEISNGVVETNGLYSPLGLIGETDSERHCVVTGSTPGSRVDIEAARLGNKIPALQYIGRFQFEALVSAVCPAAETATDQPLLLGADGCLQAPMQNGPVMHRPAVEVDGGLLMAVVLVFDDDFPFTLVCSAQTMQECQFEQVKQVGAVLPGLACPGEITGLAGQGMADECLQCIGGTGTGAEGNPLRFSGYMGNDVPIMACLQGKAMVAVFQGRFEGVGSGGVRMPIQHNAAAEAAIAVVGIEADAVHVLQP